MTKGFENRQRHSVDTFFQIASELRWPERRNLDASSAFFDGLFEKVSVHPLCKLHCQTTGLEITFIVLQI